MMNREQDGRARDSEDFRLFLLNELVSRSKKNPRYSLRAFSKQLGVESSSLSKIMKGKRALTPEMIVRLGSRLNLNIERINQYRKIHLGLAFDGSFSSAATPFSQLSEDTFNLISDWYHYAILELVRVKGFKPKAKWVAKVLGISVSEVNLAIERLVRLELLTITKRGDWLVENHRQTTNIGSQLTSAALRKLQRQILEKALMALEDVPISRRENSAMIMAIDTRRLPEAQARIQKFRKDLCRFLEEGETVDQVYHLGVCLYPASHIIKERIKS